VIFCFTGTGNSLYAAQTIANANNDKVILIADAYKAKQFAYTLANNESVGFVFPIYFWGLPTIVDEFIAKLRLNNYKEDTFTLIHISEPTRRTPISYAVFCLK